jgi:hypothetical protein
LLEVMIADPFASPATHSDREGQEMLVSHDWHGWLPLGSVHWAVAVSTRARLQAPAPPVGLAELTTLPLSSPATQSVADAHESVSSGPWSTVLTAQLPGPAVGSVDVITWPAPSTATHNDADGQETAFSDLESTWAIRHALAPLAGSLELATFPAWSTAMQSDAVGQDTDANGTELPPDPPSTCAAFHATVPPPGSVELSTLPPVSTPTHNAADGQETAVGLPNSRPESTCVTPQACIPPVGLVEVSTSPRPSTPAQNDSVGHETPSGTAGEVYGGGWSMSTGALQEIGPDATAGALIMSAANQAAMATATTVRELRRPPTPQLRSALLLPPDAHAAADAIGATRR